MPSLSTNFGCVCVLSPVPISRKNPRYWLKIRQSDYVKDDCSTSKLLCCSLIIGDFYDLREPGFRKKSVITYENK